MGQISNVLIILAIALLMAVITVVFAYFVDLIPSAIGKSTLLATNIPVWAQLERASAR